VTGGNPGKDSRTFCSVMRSPVDGRHSASRGQVFLFLYLYLYLYHSPLTLAANRVSILLF